MAPAVGFRTATWATVVPRKGIVARAMLTPLALFAITSRHGAAFRAAVMTSTASFRTTPWAAFVTRKGIAARTMLPPLAVFAITSRHRTPFRATITIPTAGFRAWRGRIVPFRSPIAWSAVRRGGFERRGDGGHRQASRQGNGWTNVPPQCWLAGNNLLSHLDTSSG
jgi:hypothetical protein